MKYFIHILSILILVIGFSSCQKVETEGFDQAEISLEEKALLNTQDSDDDDVKPLKSYRDDAVDSNDNDDDHITDDEDDEDEDENNPSANR